MLVKLREAGFLTEREVREAVARPVHLEGSPFPDAVPSVWPSAGAGLSSIDPALQSAVESLAAAAPPPDGVAIVVVENETAAVLARCGARRPDADAFDATAAARSAGSTVKPFLYALALDEGLVAPDTALLDLPWSSPDWAPRDFDPGARGPVRARDALATSLNLPAVRLCAELPRGAFASVLIAARSTSSAGRDRCRSLLRKRPGFAWSSNDCRRKATL